MCFHFKINATSQQISEFLQSDFDNGSFEIIDEDFNGFTFPKTPVLTNDNTSIQLFEWGLIPTWAKDKTFQKNTLNARVETLNEKPSFKDSISNRCLIVASHFYEWQWQNKSGVNKRKYNIAVKENPLFCFAGLYNTWKDTSTGEILNTYTIITTKANKLMSIIHNTRRRMPIILKQENFQDWLNPEIDYNKFSFPFEQELIATPEDGALSLF